MVIRGFFSRRRLTLSRREAPTAIPYVHVLVSLPAFGRYATIDFLVDTGADVTVIHPQDSLRLLTADEMRGLQGPVHIGGVGGGETHYPVDALLIFADESGSFHPVRRTLYIAQPPHGSDFNSLLGRDVLAHFALQFEQRSENLTLDPV